MVRGVSNITTVRAKTVTSQHLTIENTNKSPFGRTAPCTACSIKATKCTNVVIFQLPLLNSIVSTAFERYAFMHVHELMLSRVLRGGTQRSDCN